MSPRCIDARKVPILDEGEYIARHKAALPPEGLQWRSFYSSVVGGVVKDPTLMLVPIDDHMIHRGHAVFDTCNIRNGRAFGLDFHIDRLLRSAEGARIEHNYTKEALRETILMTIAAGGRREGVDAFARYWLSAGRGNFRISPRSCTGALLYVVVTDDPGHPESVEEWTVGVPLKTGILAECKTNNYMLNALTAMESQDKGGYGGIWINDGGYVAETCTGNVAIVDRFGVLRSPPYDGTILAGTTVLRAFAVAPQLIQDGHLMGFKFDPVHSSELLEAKEIMILGGGAAVSVVKINGVVVGERGQDGEPHDPKPGPVFRFLRELLAAEGRKVEILSVEWTCEVSGERTLCGQSGGKGGLLFLVPGGTRGAQDVTTLDY